jgi:acyl-CoA hydrolase
MTTLFDPLLDLFQQGDVIFIPGCSAEPRELVQAIHTRGSELGAIRIVNSFVPGVNRIALAAENNSICEDVFFPRSAQAQLGDQIRLIPLSYYGVLNHLRHRQFDWVVAHLSPPDPNGNCTFGAAVEFMPTVLPRTKHIIGIINRQMPRLPNSGTVHVDELHISVEIDSPLVSYDTGVSDDVSTAIACYLSELIPNGAVLQVGLGKIPDKLLASLRNHRDLRFHSGMLSDGFLQLYRAGALNPDFSHITCCALGTQQFYRQLPDITRLKICGVEDSHNPGRLGAYDDLVAINSALQVDLLGQANLESVGARQVSSVGGAPDFSRAASCSENGKSIIALPATAALGQASRIVPRFAAGHAVSLPRHDVDYVVTEFGVAELKGKSVRQRAHALLNIAAPQFREELAAHLHTMLSTKECGL